LLASQGTLLHVVSFVLTSSCFRHLPSCIFILLWSSFNVTEHYLWCKNIEPRLIMSVIL